MFDVSDTQRLISLVTGSIEAAYFWQVSKNYDKFHIEGGMSTFDMHTGVYLSWLAYLSEDMHR